MSFVADFTEIDNRINDIEYTLSDITGGGYSYDLTSKSITVYSPKAVTVDDNTTQQQSGVTIYPSNVILNSTQTINGVSLFGRNYDFQVTKTNYGVLIGGESKNDIKVLNNGVAIFGRNNNSAIRNINGVCLYGNNTNAESSGTIIAGNNFTHSGTILNGIFICNDNATFSDQIYGNCTYICGNNATLSGGSVCNSFSGQNTRFNNYNTSLKGFRVMITTPADAPIDNFKERMGITIVGYNNSSFRADLSIDKTYKIYYPNKLNYSAQTYGYVRYTKDMNITDPDGEYIIKNGKLIVSDEIASLKEEIAQLREMINNLSK